MMFLNATKVVVMPKLFSRTQELVVDFCDRCASVCDSRCRRHAAVERSRDRVLFHRGRIV